MCLGCVLCQRLLHKGSGRTFMSLFGRSGVRSVTPRPDSQTAPKCLKVGFTNMDLANRGRSTCGHFWEMAPLSVWLGTEGCDHLLCSAVQLLGLLSFPLFAFLSHCTFCCCTDGSAGLQPRVRDIFTFPRALSYSCNTAGGFSTIRDHMQMSFSGDCLNPWLWFILSWGQDIHP